MRKRLFIGVIMMLCLLLGACGKEEEATGPVTITPDESNEVVVETQEEQDSSEAEEEKEPENEPEPQKAVTGDMFASGATIEETVLVDQDDVKITATGIDYTDTRATLHLLIENNTTEERSFHSSTLGYSMNTINGCVVPDGFVDSDVAAGMKALEDVHFDKSTLLTYGIHDIAEIGMSFYVDNGDNDTLFKTDLKTIPTSIYDQYDWSEDTIKTAINDGIWENELSMNLSYVNTDFVCSQEGLNISAVVIAKSMYDRTSIYLELENTTNQTERYSSVDITLNGITVSSGRWDSYCIPANKRALAEFNLEYLIDEEYRSLITEDSVTSLSFKLSRVNFDSYDEISSSTVTVVFDENAEQASVDGTPIYDANGIKLYMLPVTEDDFGSYYYIPIYIENNSGNKVHVGLDSKTFAMGGFMVDCYGLPETVDDGKNAVMKIEIRQEEAKKMQINSIADFTSATCKLEIRNNSNYKIIDNPSIELNFQ